MVNHHAVTHRDGVGRRARTDFVDNASWLVTLNDELAAVRGGLRRAQRVQVTAAHAGCHDPDDDLTRARHGIRELPDLDPRLPVKTTPFMAAPSATAN